MSRPAPQPALDVNRRQVTVDGKEIVIFDLPRVDEASLVSLEDHLRQGGFDAVAVELDEQRKVWLDQRDDPEDLNVLEIFRAGEGARLGGYLALRILQKRLGSFHEREPGDDLRVAMAFAEEEGLPLHYVDRDVERTGLRAWRHASRLQRIKMGLAFGLGPFRRARPREDAEDRGARSRRMERLSGSMPTVAEAFVDERETYMAQKLAAIDGSRIAMVVSSPHTDNIADKLGDFSATDDGSAQIEALDYVPPKTLMSKLLPWLISIFIVLVFVAGFYFGDTETLQNMALTWALINVLFTAGFTAAALAHPASIAAAALSAPLVSLNPTVGAGFVGAAVQSVLVPPGLAEVERLGDDILRLRGWWENRLARLALIFVFANGGSTIATFVAIAVLPRVVGGG